PAIIASAALHLLLVAALLVGLRARPPREAIVPPASFAMVFEHGGAPRATTPKAKRHGAPEKPHPAAPAAVPLAPVFPLHKFAKAPPENPAPPARLGPPQPQTKQLSVRLPEPPPKPPMLQAMLAPPPPLLRRPLLPPPRAPAASKPPRYLVMDRMSFGAPGHAPAEPRRGLDLALNRSVLNAAFAKNFAIEGKIGPDWRAELAAWVNERKYYPRAAVQMDQQGAVEIRFVVERNGRVHAVALVRSSGSPFLDEAWLGLFQNAELPRFPPGTKAKELTIRATMHYILID
ncbi:MAG: energy transducer TonB, partial [Acetobacteraceae bacterium]